MKHVIQGFGMGMLIVAVWIAVMVVAVVLLPEKSRVCEYELNAQGQKIGERCWNEWGDQ